MARYIIRRHFRYFADREASDPEPNPDRLSTRPRILRLDGGLLSQPYNKTASGGRPPKPVGTAVIDGVSPFDE